MINHSYIGLFSVKVVHTYFIDNVCSCLNITPSGSTKEIMNRFGFKWIKNQNVYNLYGKTVGTIDESLNYIQNVSGEKSFEFEITANRSNFNIITDFPLDWNSIIYYNTGSSLNITGNETTEIKANFEDKSKSSLIAHLIVQFEDILKLHQKQSGADFVINFNSRSTRWNYYIINTNSIQLDNPKISGKQNIQFEGPVSAHLENGQEALKFTTGKKMLPLSEVPYYKFKLINENSSKNNVIKQSSSGKVILDSLPNPNPDKIKIEKSSSENIATSDMYVYV